MPVIDFHLTDRRPYADGRVFDGAPGPYEVIEGVVTFAVDPAHPVNEGIVDLHLAPRDADGRVRFRSDLALVTPADGAHGSGKLLVELPNRGRRLFGTLNHAPALEGVSAGGDPGDGFLMRHGWSVASIGWQWDVIRYAGLLGFDPPPVLQGGLPVTGQNVVTIRPNNRDRVFLLANRVHAPYPVHRLDDPNAVLYVRDHENGADTVVPREQWRFARENADGSVVASREHVYMKDGFEPGKTYNLVYEAEGACVVGAGLLAFRDIASFLREPGASNPAPGGFEHVYGFGISQTGRMLRHFLYLGLNVDEAGRQAYDGIHAHVAGARRGEFNHRFAQPSVQLTPNFGHLFPFLDEEAIDPYSERRNGLLTRQRDRGGVPRIVYTNTAAEYWRGDAALEHTDATGQEDVEPADEARVYLFAGCQHGAGSLPQKDTNPNEGTRGRYAFNTVDYVPLLRAALLNLDAWVADGVEPPPSAHPSLRDANLVPPVKTLATIATLPAAHTPEPEVLWALREVDLGPQASEGVGRYPAALGRKYPHLVPAVDADGNEVAGVRLPDLTVPVGTHAGWNPRHPETGSPDQIIAMMGWTRFFPPTRAAREQTGDPRVSIEERYESREAYLQQVRIEAQKLAAQRYVLEEDVELIVANCGARWDAAMGAP